MFLNLSNLQFHVQFFHVFLHSFSAIDFTEIAQTHRAKSISLVNFNALIQCYLKRGVEVILAGRNFVAFKHSP